jgi:DHA3 family macrolide efflux protein-like MFS transporter
MMKQQTQTFGTFEKSAQKTTQGWKIPFFTIWAGQAFSLLGSQLVSFALIWYLTKTTGSAKVLAMASLMEWLPRVIIGPVAGAITDRWNRRSVMIISDGFIAFATGVLLYLAWSGDIAIWHIYLLMMVRSIGGSFHFPAMTASTALMVPETQLSRIQGLNQLLQGLMNIAAPPLGALLVEILSLHGVLAIDIGTALLAVSALLIVKIPQPKIDPQANEKKLTVWGDMKAGFRYVWE